MENKEKKSAGTGQIASLHCVALAMTACFFKIPTSLFSQNEAVIANEAERSEAICQAFAESLFILSNKSQALFEVCVKLETSKF